MTDRANGTGGRYVRARVQRVEDSHFPTDHRRYLVRSPQRARDAAAVPE